MGMETADVKDWAQGALLADATLVGLIANRVAIDTPEEDWDYPFVRVSALIARDVFGVGPIIWKDDIMLSVEVLYRSTSPKEYLAARQVARRVFKALHAQQLIYVNAATGANTWINAVRVRSMEYPDPTGGVYVRSLCQYFHTQVGVDNS